ncbi:MAG: hypothetical protein IKZ16_01340 [Clostridia bacterium]|nr:hypothetical protein [Clostridia bacterium]
MKYTGKALVSLLAGVMLCASLVGCVGGNGNVQDTTEKATTEKTTTEKATTVPGTTGGVVDDVVGDVSEALTTQTETTTAPSKGMDRMRPGMRGRDGK